MKRKHVNTWIHIYLVMPNLTLSVPPELYEAMKRHPEIRWSEVARRAIARRVEDLDALDAMLSKSTLTEDDVRELAEKVNKAAWEKHKYLPGKKRRGQKEKRGI